MNQPLPVFTISSGDPSGIGPEVAVKACADESLHALARWVIVGEAWQVAELAEQFGLTVDQVESWPDRINAVTIEQVNAADRFGNRREDLVESWSTRELDVVVTVGMVVPLVTFQALLAQ